MNEAEEDVSVEVDSGDLTGVKDESKPNNETSNAPSSTPLDSSPPSASASLQALTDRALYFLSHASHETLGACVVGLGATTYLILGRVGLVLIGVVGGVALHATWQERTGGGGEQDAQQDSKRRRELGLDVAKKVLQWRTGRDRDEGDDIQDVKVYATETLSYDRFKPETAAALTTFTDTVIKDYVRWWYDPVLPAEESFPSACRRTLTAFLLSLTSHLSRKRPADTFLDFVTNASSIIIVFLNELSAALNASPNTDAAHAVSTYLEMKPDSSLANVTDIKGQERKLVTVSEDILQAYLDPKSYNCPPVQAFLKEILAQLVLGGTITTCSRPEWINEWIVYALEESETTKEVMEIVDAGVEGSTKGGAPKSTDQAVAKEEANPIKEVSEVRPGHKRQMSRAEEAMDDAMQEARRLTQLMIEEDEKRERERQAAEASTEEASKQVATSSSEDVSDVTTQGTATPTSSQSDRDRHEQEIHDTSTEHETSKAVEEPPTTPPANKPFTSFDQILPQQQPTALTDSPEKARREPAQLTLHNATISIFDDSMPGERTNMKVKPTMDYLIQIEPTSSAFPGWMIARKYADFEVLHEVLRRIGVITGARFTEAHGTLPPWKTQAKASLRAELERYLSDATRFQSLAESEGMKRFLEKEQGLTKSPGTQAKGFGWPTPDAFGKLGGDMISVLAKAPKDVAGGGKALFGGVAGVLGGGRKGSSQANLSRTNTNKTEGSASPVRPTRPSASQLFAKESYTGDVSYTRGSEESLRNPTSAAHEREASRSTASIDLKPRPSVSSQASRPERPSSEQSRSSSAAPPSQAEHWAAPEKSDISGVEDTFNLPPLPTDITDDYGSPRRQAAAASTPVPEAPRSVPTLMPDGFIVNEPSQPPPTPPRVKKKAEPKPKAPITEQETQVAVELMFAVITELYTLSSAWNIRRTLLTAAKTFLLRPGNPQLETIRQLLQTSMLDSNLSDAGIAGQIYKLRENALPTEEELKIWARDYPEKTAEQKEELRVKARSLLVTKGMPQALTSVMGAAASGEALGKVFDCLQVPSVSRGLIFGLLLQGLKVVTH